MAVGRKTKKKNVCDIKKRKETWRILIQPSEPKLLRQLLQGATDINGWRRDERHKHGSWMLSANARYGPVEPSTPITRMKLLGDANVWTLNQSR